MSEPLNVLSLFAGIGGLELGLERAGMCVVGQVEIDPYCRRVLAKHWPDVPRHDDVRTAADWWLSEERPTVDVICGGFPCQPFSHAGRRLGVADERWGWPWFADVVRVVGPRYVVVENVAALLRDRDAFGWLLRDLAALGFDAEWSVLSACAVGAPHTRERLFLVAYPNGEHGPSRLGTFQQRRRERQIQGRDGAARAWADRVDWSVEAARIDDRDIDGFAPRMVAMGGNAVVPAVAEYVGRLIVDHAVSALGGVA
jgi:DNA (cytosine-5)-methyltransferase 1